MTPSKEDMDILIMNTENVEELWNKLPRDKTFYSGIFDRYYGVSTYKKAKEVLLKSEVVTIYNPSRKDNKSIVYSQLLGDGHYDKRRHAIQITHGIKQAEYLKAKVAMITKAYPKLSSKVVIREHKQGHKYANWYSTKLGNIDIPDKEDYYKLIPELTPLGWLLWWLDDGGWYQNIAIFSINEDIVNKAVEVLKTYGIEARPCPNGFCMCGRVNDVRFYKTFIEPLTDYIPECMKYKVKI
jgi:hypothetical protein